VAFACFLVGIFTGFHDSLFFELSIMVSFPLFVLSIVTMFLYGISIGIARIMHTKRIRNARAHLCPACSYDLNGRDPCDDRCSECGSLAPKRECVRLWCKLLRSWI